MCACVVGALLEVLTVVSDLGAAVAGAAKPATARTPVSKNVAAIFFIRGPFDQLGAKPHYKRQYTVTRSIDSR
jgi:hypothetical protein